MITVRISTEIKDDRRVVVALPPEVPLGQAELVVMVASQSSPAKPRRSSLAEWADQHAEPWANRISSEDVGSFTGRKF